MYKSYLFSMIIHAVILLIIGLMIRFIYENKKYQEPEKKRKISEYEISILFDEGGLDRGGSGGGDKGAEEGKSGKTGEERKMHNKGINREQGNISAKASQEETAVPEARVPKRREIDSFRDDERAFLNKIAGENQNRKKEDEIHNTVISLRESEKLPDISTLLDEKAVLEPKRTEKTFIRGNMEKMSVVYLENEGDRNATQIVKQPVGTVMTGPAGGGQDKDGSGVGEAGEHSGSGDKGTGSSSGGGGSGGKGGKGARCPEDMAQVTLNGRYFCIDLFEYPNVVGDLPAVELTGPRTAAICESQGKRLCNISEWKKACEGVKGNAYPYGNKQDRGRCNTAGKRLQPAGTYPLCVSDFHVYDLSGNAAELVRGNKKGEYFLAGGAYNDPGEANSCKDIIPYNNERSDIPIGVRCCK